MVGTFDKKATIKTIFSDTMLSSMFKKQFNISETNALKSVDIKLTDFLIELHREVIDTTPRLKGIYTSISPEVKLTKKSKKPKRLSLKELKRREEERGYQTENDRAMISVNQLENMVAQLQRRGDKEIITDLESREIISAVRLFERKMKVILKDTKLRGLRKNKKKVKINLVY